MLQHTRDVNREQLGATVKQTDEYRTGRTGGKTDAWMIHLGDCVETLRGFDPECVDYSLFSPPFASLYTYSNSPRDMGNCGTYAEFAAHFGFLVAELYRVLKPGRLVSFHCMNLPTTKEHHGYIGIQDFRGDLIRQFQAAGFIYHSEVCVWKDPVTAMQRTKALGLLHKQLKKDSCMSRQGIPDFVVTVRKPGVNPAPVSHTNDTFPVDRWQRYASPVWMDIDQSDTLNNYRDARQEQDERHICPLQLGVIERCLELWSRPGDLVLSPFAGIGSEGYVALKMKRRFVGCELKPSYFEIATANLRRAEAESSQPTLFDCLGESETTPADAA
ncbi:DNA methylase [Gemmata obscuriglobus]|uniref:Methyltransferase n=2 Tax=Gemmata obscuriglobus TaxID=114 RepID=A0A2Z3HEW0_9BACT|nr:DNA methylase [Gemmata obscuriglobus]